MILCGTSVLVLLTKVVVRIRGGFRWDRLLRSPVTGNVIEEYLRSHTEGMFVSFVLSQEKLGDDNSIQERRFLLFDHRAQRYWKHVPKFPFR